MFVFALSFNWFTGFVASYLLLLKNFKGKLSTEKYKKKDGGYRWAVNEVMQLLTIGLKIYLITFAIFSFYWQKTTVYKKLMKIIWLSSSSR